MSDSKFLEQVELNMPTDELDKLIEGKRALQRFLFNNGVKDIVVKQFRDEIIFTLDDGSKVKVEVKDYTPAVDGVEDQEDKIKKTAETAATLFSIPDPGIGKLIPGSTAAKLQKAKKTLADKLIQKANSIRV